jgi:hypothetical protein
MEEGTMRFSSMLAAVIVVALVTGAFSPPAEAEKREMTYIKTESRSVSKSAVTLSDSPNHEVSQEVLLQKSKFSHPDFQVAQEWIYIHTDQLDGSGTHKGYYTFVHGGGEHSYGIFEGSHKTVARDDGSWLSTWEGTYRYLGGTGKYKNIKGNGTYKGKIGSKQPFYEEGREQIEY